MPLPNSTNNSWHFCIEQRIAIMDIYVYGAKKYILYATKCEKTDRKEIYNIGEPMGACVVTTIYSLLISPLNKASLSFKPSLTN